MSDIEPTVSRYMSTPVVVVRDHDSIWHAIDRFTGSGLHHLVVLDKQDNLLGVLEDRQLLPSCLLLENVDARPRSVGQVLKETIVNPNSKPETYEASTVQTAAATMLRQHVHALAVVDARGQVLGVITMSDLLRALIGAHLEVPEEPTTSPVIATLGPSVETPSARMD